MRYAVRALAGSPTFTLVATITLALGIGANTALFSAADLVLTRPLPVQRPHELVLFRTVGAPAWPEGQALVPFALYERIRSQSSAFAEALVLEYDRETRMRVRARNGRGGLGTLMWAMPVSGSFFTMLGVAPALGRVFTSDEDRPGAQPLAVISYGFWQRRYGADPGVLGQRLTLETAAGLLIGKSMTATIVGVAPREFRGVDLDLAPDVWLTIVPAREASGAFRVLGTNSSIIRAMARLRPGVSLPQAQAEIDGVAASAFQILRERGPRMYADAGPITPRIRVESAASGYSALRERFRDPLLILMAAVVCVLLLACTNVAALLFARAAARHKEIAIRLAIGSGRLAIVRLLLTEAALLAAVAGTLALLAFSWVRAVVTAYLPVESGFASAGVLDARILGFTGAVSLLSVLLVGLAPALWISRLDLNRLIREPQGRSGSVAKLHRAIIPVQVACSLALLVGAGLFLRTLQNLRAVDTGFDQRRVIQFSIDARSDGDWASRRTAGLPSTLLERLAALPGVESLTFYNRGGLLQERDNTNQPVTVTARDGVLPREALDVPTISVGPRFFDTMGISLVAGRSFGSSIAMFSRDAVLSASLARQLFGKEQDAVGRSVYLPSLALGVDETHRVIGVAEDVPYGSLRDSHVRTLYFGRPQASASSTSRFALRTHEDAAQLTPAIRAVVREFSVDFEVVDMRTLHDITEASIVGERLVARLTGILGLLALLLAAIGIYGVIAYAVTRRTGEIGLRMALGARAGHVVGMIVGQVMALVAAGLAFGVLGIGVFARLISRQLFGVTPYDVTTIAVALLLLASVCAAAAYLPVSRAANRIDPVVALREQ